jgi:hypothetical protein
MSTRVGNEAVRNEFREIIAENADVAAGANDLISKNETKKLEPFLVRIDEVVRNDGGKGTRVKTGALVERAMDEATSAWTALNVTGPKLWSKKEIADLKVRDPELGALTEEACMRVRLGSMRDPVPDVQRFFNKFDFSDRAIRHRGEKLDIRPGMRTREDIPAQVSTAFDYYSKAQERDVATVNLHKAKIAGHEVYLISTFTDGDDGYLEIYKRDGSPISSARLSAETLFAWDEYFGRARATPIMTRTDDSYERVEGLSEPAEALAAGQLPHDWVPDLKIDSGFVTHRNFILDRVQIDAPLTEQQRDVVYATLELLFDNTLRYRGESGEQIRLGPNDQGTLRLGTFTRPDGERFLIADWKDIDDASFTYYFKPTDGGVSLLTEQNNG